MIIAKDIESARKQILKSNEKPKIVKAQDDLFNRKIIEFGRFDVILGIESGIKRKDNLKQLDSGLNEILARIAARNKIAIGIDLEELRNLDKKEKALRIGRISQNIKICRKTKTKIFLANIKDKIDAFFFLVSIGASTQQAKEAVSQTISF